MVRVPLLELASVCFHSDLTDAELESNLFIQ
jgi:hypothetical protein